jgi:hypothetical protein
MASAASMEETAAPNGDVVAAPAHDGNDCDSTPTNSSSCGDSAQAGPASGSGQAGAAAESGGIPLAPPPWDFTFQPSAPSPWNCTSAPAFDEAAGISGLGNADGAPSLPLDDAQGAARPASLARRSQGSDEWEVLDRSALSGAVGDSGAVEALETVRTLARSMMECGGWS